MLSIHTGAIAVMKYSWYAWGLFIFEYLQIPATQVLILTILMTADFAAGICKQISLDPQWVTSRRAKNRLMSKLWTLWSVFVISLVMTWVGPEWEFYVYLTAFLSLLIVAEWYSVLQNIYVIRTGKIITEYDAVSNVIKWMGEIFITFIERMIWKK